VCVLAARPCGGYDLAMEPRSLYDETLGVDPGLIAEAWAHGVPCPFYEVAISGQASNGRYGELRVQFDDKDEAAAYAGVPRPGHDSPARDALESALGAPLVTSSGGVSLCYDPRAWDGGPVR
jgi:hypothetical protein